jgi:hypothetical protein
MLFNGSAVREIYWTGYMAAVTGCLGRRIPADGMTG